MTRVAAVDCGTNSLRLLVADLDREAGTAVDVVRMTQIVRLGQDVDRTGRFAAEAFSTIKSWPGLWLKMRRELCWNWKTALGASSIAPRKGVFTRRRSRARPLIERFTKAI